MSTAHLSMAGGAEFDLIRRLLARWGKTALGIGDDAAILPPVAAGETRVVSTDASVAEYHFRERWLEAGLITPREIGIRAAVAAFSDLAAMGASPRALLLSLVVPRGWEARVEGIADGIGVVAEGLGAAIVGGNVSGGATFSATSTVIGDARRIVSRRGARVGDVAVVSGVLGGPAAALAFLERGESPPEPLRERFMAPVARIVLGERLAGAGATAMLDVSDGLLADAAHLAAASAVTLSLESARIPAVAGVSIDDALTGGEEYELLATVPQAQLGAALAAAAAVGTPLTVIGAVTAGDGSALLVDGKPVASGGGRVENAAGHDHLSR